MEKKMINLTIDSRKIAVEEGSTILDAARKINIDIPTLCFLKEINEVGACRMCIVEVEGARGYVASCVYPVTEGMVVKTNTYDLIETKRTILQLLLSNHEKNCLTCVRSTNCELQNLAKKFNVDSLPYEGAMTEKVLDTDSACISRNTAKCVLCKRCVNVCRKVQGVSAIDTVNRGFKSKIGVAFNMSISKSTCVGCGQCIVHCPVAALQEKDYTREVKRALSDPNVHVVIQTAPSVRASIGEEFGMEIGTLATGKMVAGLRKLGFDKIFDTDLAADVTIMEEGTEFLERLNNGGKLPMITSCSSGWITFAEKFYPNLLENLSTTKSPMEIMAVLIKKYYAEKMGIDPKNIFSVALMPCSAKKAEAIRPELKMDGMQLVDQVITTREMARLLKEANIDIATLEDDEFDSPLGEATGAGHIFGTTGGVMEAALRTISELATNKPLENIEFNVVRGVEGIKEAKINLGDKELWIAVAQGLKNVSKVMDEIEDGTSKYSFIEVMTCPGGCIMGGGQPIKTSYERAKVDVRGLRAKALYKADKDAKYRSSHKNPEVQKIYEEFLGAPNSHRAHELMHTKYHKQDVYVSDNKK
ncbi:MAG: NADH-dependent [FeFe] hydrogenase, group A6 [Clostridia bacterium]|nr:NADH-dependent [FeFe] hydrogenase, group A6 [Clostridia bacterium]